MSDRDELPSGYNLPPGCFQSDIDEHFKNPSPARSELKLEDLPQWLQDYWLCFDTGAYMEFGMIWKKEISPKLIAQSALIKELTEELERYADEIHGKQTRLKIIDDLLVRAKQEGK